MYDILKSIKEKVQPAGGRDVPAVRVDPERCTRCMLCVQDCVSGVFRAERG
ncbi:MAG: 4Fe-4S binding protein, partial [Deltaproteobacteria bacterium]|nr:4Fe-4S binding protein [Deltaproteobacteria bacterium]